MTAVGISIENSAPESLLMIEIFVESSNGSNIEVTRSTTYPKPDGDPKSDIIVFVGSDWDTKR